MPHLCLLLLVTMLSACAPSLKINSNANVPASWQQQSQQRAHLSEWVLRGRVSIQTQDDGGVVDLIWHQSKQNYSIQLTAPLGAGGIALSTVDNGVMLNSSNGRELFAKDAETLLQNIQGWRLPVSGLRYWLLAMPVPKKNYQFISWLDNQQLHVMQQDGWHIEFRQYQQQGNVWLPRKIFMHRLDNTEIDVRIVIRDWTI